MQPQDAHLTQSEGETQLQPFVVFNNLLGFVPQPNPPLFSDVGRSATSPATKQSLRSTTLKFRRYWYACKAMLVICNSFSWVKGFGK